MENDYYISLFEENFFHPKQPDDLENWCGGNGVMLAVDPDGIIYPCLRYMESSLAGQQEPYSIGDVDTGICQTECDRCRVECLKKIDRRTQSTDECFNCPVAEGCSWCTAYNYQVFGTPDAEDERQNKRLELLEENTKQINSLTTSVEKLAQSIQLMCKEQEQQGARLESLESRDGEMWKQVTGYVLTTVIGLAIGFFFKQFGF